MQQDVTGELERNDLVHVFVAALHVLEIADPDIVLQRVFHEPVPGARTGFSVRRDVPLADPDELVKEHDRLDDIGGVWKHGFVVAKAAVAGEAAVGPGRIFSIAPLEVFHKGGGAQNRGAEIFGVAGHFIEADIGVAVFADDVRFDKVFAVLAPAGILFRARVRGRIRNLRPGVVGRGAAVFKFVVDETFKKFERARVAGVGIQALDEALGHRTEVASGVDPFRIGDEFEGSTVKIEAAVEIGQTLAVVLIPQYGPLREKIAGIRVAGAVGHRPREQFVLIIESYSAAGDGWLVHDGNYRKWGLSILRGYGGEENSDSAERCEKPVRQMKPQGHA